MHAVVHTSKILGRRSALESNIWGHLEQKIYGLFGLENANSNAIREKNKKESKEKKRERKKASKQTNKQARKKECGMNYFHRVVFHHLVMTLIIIFIYIGSPL